MAKTASLPRIQAIAGQHMSLQEDELERLLDRTWVKSGLIGQVPVRGSRSDFWRKLQERLSERASTEAESISVLTGMVASDVVDWTSTHGIPAIESYEYPIGLLVAWVTLAAVKKANFKSTTDGKGGGSRKSGQKKNGR